MHSSPVRVFRFALPGVLALSGCAADAYRSEVDAFRAGVRDVRSVVESHVDQRRDASLEDRNRALAGRTVDIDDACFEAPLRLARAAACAADSQAAAGSVPTCERPSGVLQPAPDAARRCQLGVLDGDTLLPLSAPTSPLAIASDIGAALDGYADALDALSDARGIRGLQREARRLETALTGLGNGLGRGSARATGPLAGVLLGASGLAFAAEREAVLGQAIRDAAPLVREAAERLSYLLAPAFVDRLDARLEALDTALDTRRAAASDSERALRALARVEREHARYVALLSDSPGAALEAMADAHDALADRVAAGAADPDAALDAVRRFVRRAEAATRATR